MKLAAIKDQKTARLSVLTLAASRLLTCFNAKETEAQFRLAIIQGGNYSDRTI
jgi:hypothetical protein